MSTTPRPTPPPDRDRPEPWGEAPPLRSLRIMVTILTATLSIGVLTIAAALVIRIFSETPAPPPPLAPPNAAALILPEGAEIIAVGAGPAALAVATRAPNGAETLRLFDPDTGAEIAAIPFQRPAPVE